MENTNRLSSILNVNSNASRQVKSDSTQTDNFLTFNFYLRTFSLIVNERFPESDIDRISLDEIQTIADFCAACSRVALERWERVQSSSQTHQKAA